MVDGVMRQQREVMASATDTARIKLKASVEESGREEREPFTHILGQSTSNTSCYNYPLNQVYT